MKRFHGNGRTGNGRFQIGNKAACGHRNPLAARRAELQKAFVGAVSDDAVKAIVGKLVAQATAGDVLAARLFLSYALGPPSKDHDGVPVADVLHFMAAIRSVLDRHIADPILGARIRAELVGHARLITSESRGLTAAENEPEANP